MSFRRTLIASTALAAMLAAAPGLAQATVGSMQVGNATVSVGAGAAVVYLPDVRFLEIQNNAFDTLNKRKTQDIDGEYGFAVNGSVSFPVTGHLGYPRSVVVSGFYANIDDDDRRDCISTATALCGFKPIIDDGVAVGLRANPGFLMTGRADREVDHWGVSVEGRHHLGGMPGGLKDAPVAPSRYWALGFDVRAIDQDTVVTATVNTTPGAMRYSEELETTYYGVYLAYGGDYTLPFFGGITSSLGLQSSFRLWGGLYYADTDYSGRYSNTIAGFNDSQRLSLSEDEAAFIGGLTLETRKRIGARTHLSLKSDYEYYSYVPEMRYNSVVSGAACAAPNTCRGASGTRIGDDDGFAIHTTLRFTIGLGPDSIYQY